MFLSKITTKITNTPSFIWTHKKKTVFFSLVAAWAGEWIMKNLKDDEIRKFYAEKAVKFGQEPISPDEKPRRLTVLVNTVAQQHKNMDKFKKNALPLLHLAGIQVDIIKAESADQIESLASVLDQNEADAIYVVGGDGTLARVLTGIFKNAEYSRLPIGIFPGGNENRGLLRLVPQVFDYRKDVRPMCESAMALIEERKRILRPFKVEIVSNNPEEPHDTVYSLSDVSAGWYKMIEDYKYKFWYWGRLKRRWAYLWSSTKNSPAPLKLEVYYEEFCPGCKRCRSNIEKEQLKTPETTKNRSWWSYFIGFPSSGGMKKPERKVPQKDYSNVENPDCGKRYQLQVEGTDLIVDAKQLDDSTQLHFRIGGSEYASRFSLLRDGWKRCKTDSIANSPNPDFYTQEFVANSLELNFQHMPDAIKKVAVAGDPKTLENFEEKVVRIQATDKTVEVYLPEELREIPGIPVRKN